MRERQRPGERPSSSIPSSTSRSLRPSVRESRPSFEGAAPEPSQEPPRRTRSIEEQIAGSQRMGSFLERLLSHRPPAVTGPSEGDAMPVVQAKTRTARAQHEPEPEEIQGAAREGIRGPSGPLPHGEAIRRSFGRHDVSHVKAHVDAQAATSAQAMGAEAFTAGEHVAFAGAPSLHTAAHEAAHVIQQRVGVHLRGGVGQVGDAYERHAEEVASRVVQGESAEELLDQPVGHSESVPAVSRSVGPAVQLKNGKKGKGAGGKNKSGAEEKEDKLAKNKKAFGKLKLLASSLGLTVVIKESGAFAWLQDDQAESVHLDSHHLHLFSQGEEVGALATFVTKGKDEKQHRNFELEKPDGDFPKDLKDAAALVKDALDGKYDELLPPEEDE